MLILVRHAETSENVAGRAISAGGLGITPFGREQAKALGGWIKASSRPINVLVSPARRAVETAFYSLDPVDLYHDLKVENGLRERDIGEFEGLTAAEIDERRVRLGYPRTADPTVIWEGVADVESDEQVAARSFPLLTRYARQVPPAEDVLAITHAGVIKSILCWTLGIPPTRPHAFQISLASAVVLEELHGYHSVRELWRNPLSRRYMA